MMIKQESSQDEALHALYVLYMCFIRGIIRRLILWASVHKKEIHGSIVVGQSRKFTSSFLTINSRIRVQSHFSPHLFAQKHLLSIIYKEVPLKCRQMLIPL